MSIGTVFLGLAWLFFFIVWIVAGTANEIWPFGALLIVITIVLGIRNYRLKRK